MKRKIIGFMVMVGSFISFMPSALAIENDFCLRSSAIWQFVGYGLFALKIVIPLIIIIFGIIDFAKATVSSDDKGIKNAAMSLFRRLIVGIAIFFIPTIVSVAFNLIDNVANLEGIEECEECLFNPTGSTCDGYIKSAEEKRKEEAGAISDIRVVEDSDEDDGYGRENLEYSSRPSEGDGEVLILAGHSYSPYCGKVNNECRGAWPSSGYDETAETRKLAKVLKSSLSAIGVEADIANELLSPGDSNMSTSFFVERSLNTSVFNKYDWSKYNYAIELHFNGSSGGGASGTVVIVNSGYSGLAIDNELINAVVKYTGNSNRGIATVNTGNYSYFKKIGVPFTYLEVEFYDNKTAMDKYTSNMNNIASAMAQVIKKYYG